MGVARAMHHVGQAYSVGYYTSVKLLGHRRLRTLCSDKARGCRYGVRATPSCFHALYAARAPRRGLRAVQATQRVNFHVYSNKVVKVNRAMRRHVRVTLLLRGREVLSVPLGLLRPVPNAPLRGTRPLASRRFLAAVTLFHFVGPGTCLHFSNKQTRLDRGVRHGTLCVNVGSTVVNSLLAAVKDQMTRSGTLFASRKCSLARGAS